MFNVSMLLNNIEQNKILNKKFIFSSFVHYICSVQFY